MCRRTDYCHCIVQVAWSLTGPRQSIRPKHSAPISRCVDLTHLNKSVHRERHSLPAVEQSLAQLAGARVFSTLDANLGFWQIQLD